MKSYCNPLQVEGITSGRWLDADLSRETQLQYKDYRSIADPSVVYHDGKWIMYPSYKVAYVSEDFIHWKHVDIGIEHLRYSPAVVQFRGKWYLNAHSRPELYVSDSPLGPFTVCGYLTNAKGKRVSVCDGCFLADGDRLYFYWCGNVPSDIPGIDWKTATLGVEMNPDRPWEMLGEPVAINVFDNTVEWQRHGEYNQNMRVGWIEGQWMIKRGARYYLLYSGCGTEFSSYVNSVVYSDEGPLSGFHPQKRNLPLTIKRTGLLRGAGHGCLTEGPNGTLWCFYTTLYNFNQKFERRIGMDPIGIDENGELFCPAVTETPQYAPGVLEHPENGNSLGLTPLTFMQRPWATSFAEGHEPFYACDDSVYTWWQPAAGDEAPCITYLLDDNRYPYRLHACRILWRDIGMETLNGVFPGPFRYVVEYASDSELTQWHTLIDASDNETDLPVDYRELRGELAYGVRLRIMGAPKGITPGLVALSIFGKSDLA